MAVELHAYAVNPDETIHVKHIFYGETEREADEHFRAHVNACPMFGPAEREGRIISYFVEVDDLPTPESAEREARYERR